MVGVATGHDVAAAARAPWRWRQRSDGVEMVLTGAPGGCSDDVFAGPDGPGLNLGGHVGDDPAAVEANRHTVAAALGLPRERLIFMAQCHGATVRQVDGPWAGEPADCDAIISTEPDLALAVLVADCVPVLFADPQAGLVGAVHAGREGLAAGVLDAAVAALADLGARSLNAVVGPSICGRCYEVPAQLREQVAAAHPSSRTVSWTGTPALDLAAAVVERLRGSGVGVRWLPGCTREDPQWYSHRRSPRTGRFAAIVRRYAAPQVS